jgi:hypothetical protein
MHVEQSWIDTRWSQPFGTLDSPGARAKRPPAVRLHPGREDGGVWDDWEVSFSFMTHSDRDEAAEALDTGRRERSQTGAKEASERMKSKESG